MSDQQLQTVDIAQELQKVKRILFDELMRAARFAAIASQVSQLSDEITLPYPDLGIIFGGPLETDAKSEEPPSVLSGHGLDEEIRQEFALYSSRYSIIVMVTAFEIFLIRLLWIAKLCRWIPANQYMHISEFYRLGKEATENARHTSVDGLIRKIGNELGKELNMRSIDWFRSIYAARRCLVHRGGIVGSDDVDKDTKQLRLIWNTARLTVNGRPYEKVHDVQVEAGATVGIQFSETERSLSVGETLVLSPGESQEIAFSIFLCATDIAKVIQETALELLNAKARSE